MFLLVCFCQLVLLRFGFKVAGAPGFGGVTFQCLKFPSKPLNYGEPSYDGTLKLQFLGELPCAIAKIRFWWWSLAD